MLVRLTGGSFPLVGTDVETLIDIHRDEHDNFHLGHVVLSGSAKLCT